MFVLLDCFDPGRLWDMLEQVFLDTQPESHGAGWAAHAGPVEADFDHPVVGDIHEFEIATIGLDGRADSLNDSGDADDQCLVPGRFAC